MIECMDDDTCKVVMRREVAKPLTQINHCPSRQQLISASATR
jgi:hypothetical protein